MPGSPMSPPTFLLGPWRRALQWTGTLLLLAIPFVRVDGESLLRLDIAQLTLYLGGRAFPIEDLYLFLFLTIALLLLFLLATFVFGRAWCGWACPQTTLNDLIEWFARRIGVTVESARLSAGGGRKIVLHLFYLALATLVAVNLVWYFVSPYQFFPRLLQGELGLAAGLILAVAGALVYFDLAFLRRLMCKEFCPYGRFQSALVDPGTLTLRFHPDEASRCIRCGACVRACPMGIDIRRGYQIECINCGRCLDACREVMARRRQAGIIRYTFGSEGHGIRALLNPRLLLLTGALLIITTILGWSAAHRAGATLKLGRPPQALARLLPDARTVNFFRAVVANRDNRPLLLALEAAGPQGEDLEIRGPVSAIALQPGERHTIDFAVIAPLPGAASVPIEITLRNARGETLSRNEARLVAAPPVPPQDSP